MNGINLKDFYFEIIVQFEKVLFLRRKKKPFFSKNEKKNPIKIIEYV